MNVQAGLVVYGNVITQNLNVNVTQISSQPQSAVTSFWAVEAPIHTFVGRQGLLKVIHEGLQELMREKHFMRRILALVAMGGMGKTETARKLADDYREFYENVAWIDAETEISVNASFLKIAKILNITHIDNTKGKELTELVYRHISEHVKKPSLFIFDNASQLQTDGDVFGIFDFLPVQMTKNPPVILLTSQSTEWRRHGCKVVDVIELSTEESLTLLVSRFDLSLTEIDKDQELQDLLQNLVARLNGYPLALGLAAANILYIPGQGSLELLKQSLKKYLRCVDENKILEQRVSSQLATNYPHTLLKVWDIAMTHLGRRMHASEAKKLLSILAYCPQDYLLKIQVQRMYEARSERFGVSFPDENDASFDEALHELQTVGLMRVENYDHEMSEVKVHRLVQTLARLGDAMDFAIQKLILYNVEQLHGPTQRVHVVELAVESLLGREYIPDWALVEERKTLLWIYGLWFSQRKRDTHVSFPLENSLVCKDCYGKPENSGDMSTVAAFIFNSQVPQDWFSVSGCKFELLWTRMQNTKKVESSLPQNPLEMRLFLQYLLLKAVAEAAGVICADFCKDSMEKPRSCPDAYVQHGFQAWLYSFVYFTRSLSFPPVGEQIRQQTGSALSVLVQVRFVSIRIFTGPLYHVRTINVEA